MMRDIDVRTALHSKELAKYKEDGVSLVVDEFGLCQGDARIDVAVINGYLTGYEIKSEKDTLGRLPKQTSIYSKVLDYIVLVVCENHLKKAHAATPGWWGIIKVNKINEEIQLTQIRKPTKNPNVDPFSLVQLLWKNEVLEILREKELDKGLKNKPRKYLWEALVKNSSLDELNFLVRETLKKRNNWRSGLLQKQYGD